MKLTALRPIIWVDKFDETLLFYTEVLGFSIAEQSESWASLFKDSIDLMVSRPNDHVPFEKPLFTGSFYFTTDNADELWRELKDKTKVCYEIQEFEWQMKEFAIYDNNGYILQFGQSTEK